MHLKPIFLLFSIFCFALQMKAQRFIGTTKDTVNEPLGQNWSISLGYSSIPTHLGEATIFADVPNHPVINESLPEVNLSGGPHIATLFHFREKWYWGLSYSNNSVNMSSERGRDFVSSFGLNFGFQQALKYDSKDFFAAFELGIASYNIRRGLIGFSEYNSVRLQRESAVFTPAIRLEVNLYKEQFYLFVQAKYFLSFFEDIRIRLNKDNPDEEDETDTSSIRFDDPGVEVSKSARLDFQHPYEFVIGIRYNFDF